MAFLAPLMLWGSIAAAIPIALHFFFRSRYKTVPWAAMKFLLESIEQTSRRMKFQELLLLLLRVTLLVLLALALARPLSSSVRGAGQGAAVHAVFVFDTSMSMGANDGIKTRLARAQDTALSILKQLPPHSSVQIITCADRASATAAGSESSLGGGVLGLQGPRVPEDLDQAETIIKELKPTSLATDLKDGILQAAVALEQENDNRELYIFTDMQKSAWETHADRIRKAMEDIGEKSSISVVRCGQKELDNAAIVSVIPQTDVPRPGERVDFAVQIAHTAGKDLHNLQLTLKINGAEVEGQVKNIPELKARQTKSVTLSGKLDKPGLHTVTVVLNKDDMPGDNRYDFVVRVPDFYRVLIVDGGNNDPDDADKASLASSFYLMHQIAPVSEMDYGRFHVRQKRVRARLAAAAELVPGPGKFDLCVLVNCEVPAVDKDQHSARNVLSHTFLAELENFVKGGGSLLIYGGDRVNYQQYNEVLGDKYSLLPLPLKGKAVEFPQADPTKIVKLDRGTFDLPVFRKFKDDKRYDAFNKIEIYKAFPVVEPQRKETRPDLDKDKKPERTLTEAEKKAEDKKKAEEAAKKLEQEKKEENVNVVLRYSNRWPAVISRLVGEGEVLFVTTSADPGGQSAQEIRARGQENVQFTWNNWALNPMSGPFMKNVLAHLTARTAQEHNFEAGKPLVWNARDKAKKSFTLFYPKTEDADKKDDDVKRKLERLGVPVKDENGKLVVRSAPLLNAGIYGIQAVNAADEAKVTEADEKKGEILPVAVIPDLSESRNLDTFKKDEGGKESEFDKFLSISSPVRHLQAGSGAEKSTGTDRFNREWTLWFLWALLALGLCEVALAWWCGRSF